MPPHSKNKAPRPIRSYVIRGRLTAPQRRALERYSDDFIIPFTGKMLNPDACFPRPAPLTVEIGFGDGDHLLTAARQHPEQNFLGIEVYPAGIARLMMAAAEAGTKNLKIIRHDATEVFTKLPPESLHKVLILFPDPWPKKRHHKRRLVQPDFMSIVASRLRPGAQLHLATDHQEYATAMQEAIQPLPSLTSVSPTSTRPPTKFETRAQTLGQKIHNLQYEKV